MVEGLDEAFQTVTVRFEAEGQNSVEIKVNYEAALDAKGTVVKSADKNQNNLAVLLAEGVFPRETILEMKDNLSKEAEVDGKAAIVNWNVTLSNTGVEHLHYLIPEDMDAEKVVLYVKDASGVWMEREFVIESSYIVFEFADGEIAFALVTDIWAVALYI